MTAHESNFEIPPFPAFPSISRYVAIGSLEEARQRVSRSINACEGLSLVIGPPGTGKSLLCGLLGRDFAETHDVVNLGDTPINDAATFYRHLLHHLDASFESIPEGDLQLALANRVRDKQATQKGLLILVDEAQAMPAEVLEAIRMTTNIMLDEQPRVYAVVCGGPKLDETLSLPASEPLTQRVAARCYLHPLNSQETREYIHGSIRGCDADPDATISDEAVAAVHHACCGVPRLINQLVTCAIDVAADADQEMISDAIVDRAWAELQQLPSPMIEEPVLRGGSSNVEFGQLDELDVPANEPAPDGAGSCEEEPAAIDPVDNDVAIDSSAPSSCIAEGRVIEAEESTICEKEETTEISPTVPKAVLFGDFDDEEEVDLGNGIAVTSIGAESTPIDLESMLHSEIVGIASDAADASHFVAAEERHREEANAFDQPIPEENRVLWTDEIQGREAITDDSDIVIHDDSDMLVVEDDVDVRVSDLSARIDVEEKVVSVDFQAMLAKMRHGSTKEAS